MADVKISALPAATTPLSGTEIVPIVQSGVTTQVTVGNLTAARTVAASTINVDANTSTNAVRITQTGSGNALLVEDEANPDATPFVVTASGQVGVGMTSPSAKLEVAGGVSGQQVAGRYFGFGTGTFSFDSTAVNDYGVSYTQPGDGTFNTVLAGFSTIKFATNQTERMRIGNNGNVSVGTTSTATYRFVTYNSSTAADVDAAQFISEANASGVSTTHIRLEKGGGFGGTIGGYLSQGVGSGLVLSTLNGGTRSNLMWLTSGGFVGIGPGATNPTATLNVIGHNEFSIGLVAQTSSTQTGILSHPPAILFNSSSAAGNGVSLRYNIADTGGVGRTAGGIGVVATAKDASSVTADMYFYTGTTPQERMRLTSAGNVGIGLTPATRFEVGQTSGSRARFDVSSATQVVMTFLNVAASAFVTNFANALDHRWQVSGSDAFRIETDGRLAVGTASANAAAKLDVQSTTQGFLPPRMTTAQRDLISSPPDGLILYNSTTNKLQVRAAGAWVDLH